jgi:uncharacterized protein (DUF2236 family)
MARTHAERLASRDGYFAPESVIRRVSNTPLAPVLGGGAAVLLQVAHPLVAAGVARHSGFHRELWRRLLRTLHALYFVVYGSREEADRAALGVRAVHARVHGTTEEALGPFPAGTPYSAEDPELMLWVHATLVMSSLDAYRRFGEPLPRRAHEAYYRDMGLVARLFGVPDATLPPTLSDFRRYVARMLGGGEIVVTRPAREVAEVILEAPLPAPLRLLGPAHRLATAALLPARLRAEYGLQWTRSHELRLELAARSAKVLAMPLFQAAGRLSRPSLRRAA